jgi:restriction system protein
MPIPDYQSILLPLRTYKSYALDCGLKSISPKIELIDGLTLAQYMIDYDIGVSKVKSFEIKRKNSDFFVED